MFGAILGIVLLIIGAILAGFARSSTTGALSAVPSPGRKLMSGLLILGGLFLIFSRSFVIVGADEVGLLKRVYLGNDMPPGQVIALEGEKGPRAETLPPGFHFIPFVRVLNEVEYAQVVQIPEGQYGLLIARDGLSLRNDQFLADQWVEADYKRMLDASWFLTEGKGQKGPQLTVLRPGTYRLNPYLWDVKPLPALDVATGHVAVIRSNVATAGQECPNVMETAGGASNEQVARPVVPQGCIGVWDEPLPPGRYYLNERAYIPSIIPTRLQTWSYKGGYTDRKINLRVTDEGKIEQDEVATKVPVPQDAADRAIFVRVEGWTIPVEMRVVVQVHPKDAPQVVASIGDLQRIEDNVITPTIRDVLRTIGGNPNRRVLDFIEKRDEITAAVEAVVAKEGLKAGVTIQEVRMGEPGVPPELLVARLREQLATQLEETYKQEREAQNTRIDAERARAQADQQPRLVEAEIQRQAAEFRKEQLRLEGEGEKLRLIEIAAGQKAIAGVLGPERTMQLQMLKEILQVAEEQPNIIKVPNVQVNGSAGIEGGAAVLGSLLGGSNFGELLRQQSTTEAGKTR